MNTGDQIIDAVIRAAAIEGAIPHKDGTFTFVWASNASEQIEAALAENATVCAWTQGVCFSFRNIPCGDGFYFTPSHTRYDTACGSSFRFSEEGNMEFKFCPYCGGRISLASEKEGGE
jgi:hypothetical protein